MQATLDRDKESIALDLSDLQRSQEDKNIRRWASNGETGAIKPIVQKEETIRSLELHRPRPRTKVNPRSQGDIVPGPMQNQFLPPSLPPLGRGAARCRHEDTDRPTRRYCGVRWRPTSVRVYAQGGATAGEEGHRDQYWHCWVIQVAAGGGPPLLCEPEINAPPPYCCCSSLAVPRKLPKVTSVRQPAKWRGAMGMITTGTTTLVERSPVRRHATSTVIPLLLLAVGEMVAVAQVGFWRTLTSLCFCKVNPASVGRIWNILRERALRRPDSEWMALGASQIHRARNT
ncbi:hypothetical protein H4582DRAFT_2062731 [Lactarius indigo]|nr:hypothetical protein H4582DRAFT_2062731 [Lactarius indigo]